MRVHDPCICHEGIICVAITRTGKVIATGEHDQWTTFVEWRWCFRCYGTDGFNAAPLAVTSYPDPPDCIAT